MLYGSFMKKSAGLAGPVSFAYSRGGSTVSRSEGRPDQVASLPRQHLQKNIKMKKSAGLRRSWRASVVGGRMRVHIVQYLSLSISLSLSIYIYIYLYMYMYIHISMYICIYTHTYIQTNYTYNMA